MACTLCGIEGHNSRNCPNKNENNNVNERDMAVWFKVDDVTYKETSELIKGFINLKDKVCREARGTYARADKKKLPGEIKKALSINGEKNEQ